MSQDLNGYMQIALGQIQKEEDKIQPPQVFSEEAAILRLLKELVLEQVKNEDTDRSAR